MEFRLYTAGEEIMLKVIVRTLGDKARKIRLVVSDYDKINTVFTNRYNVFNGIRTFYVRMPLSPTRAFIQVYDDEIGPNETSTTFEMVNEDGKKDDVNYGLYRLPLEKNMAEIDMKNPDIKSFITFAEQFSYNAGWLDTGNYISDDRRLKFKYSPTIYGDGGQESATPARIGEQDKVIEISQKIFVPYTVPMRFAILCHEFAHCYLNAEPANETEADLQGLLMYLSLGFPYIEAHQAFLETFIGTPTAANAKRYNIVNWYIQDFKNQKRVLNE